MSQKYSQAAIAYIQKKPSNNTVNKNNDLRGNRKRSSLGPVPNRIAGEFYSTHANQLGNNLLLLKYDIAMSPRQIASIARDE